jgi:hypothetical protein
LSLDGSRRLVQGFNNVPLNSANADVSLLRVNASGHRDVPVIIANDIGTPSTQATQG